MKRKIQIAPWVMTVIIWLSFNAEAWAYKGGQVGSTLAIEKVAEFVKKY